MVIAGAPVVFTCKAQTDPDYKLELSWLYNGFPLTQEDKRLRLTDQNLTIEKAAKSDTGEYTCVAKTDWDKQERTATLAVKGKTRNKFVSNLIPVG